MVLFDRSASDYDDWCSTPIGAYVDLLEKGLMKDTAKPQSGERVLDIGCGTGIYTYWLWEQDLKATGIDISKKMLKKAEGKRKEAGPTFVLGDIHNLSFSEATFDLVVSNITLEFVENPEKVVNEALRVLKPGGRFVCGFIGKHSSWGKAYLEKGSKNPGSVFSQATFFDSNQIKQLNSQSQPNQLRYGLFIGMNEYKNTEEATQLEEARKKIWPCDEAGYIVARWDKE